MKDLTIEEMEKLLYGVEEDEETASSDSTDQSTETEVEETHEESISATESEEDTSKAEEVESKEEVIQEKDNHVEAAEQVHDWEKRYKNYKASTDVKLHTMKMEIASLNNELSNSLKEVAKLKGKLKEFTVDKKPEFTKDEVELLGKEGVDVISKTVSNAVKPLEEELKKERDKRIKEKKEASENAAKEAYKTFIENLRKQVPDFEAINVDPNFIQFLDENTDDKTGYTFRDLFGLAERRGDSRSVAYFFKTFKAKMEEKETRNASPLEKKITPSSSSASPVSTSSEKEEEFFTEEYINKFYDDVSKGRYSVEEANRIEYKIDKAFIEGRIR